MQISTTYRSTPGSTGRNWGYGSAVAPKHGSALLSLAGLNRISDHDEALGYVTIQPGVTFRMPAHYLRGRHSRLLPPSTGSSSDTSIVGNVLERGIGKGFYEVMAGRGRACTVLLATGEAITMRAGAAGPSLLGALPQANFAVVTELTLQLEPMPRLRQFAAVYLPNAQTLARCIDALRDGLQRSAGRIHLELMNDYRFLAQRGQFPYDAFDGSSPLARPWVGAHLGLPGRPEWIAGITLWGNCEDELAIRRKLLDTALAGVLPLNLDEITAVAELPELDCEGLRCAYWRKRFPMPANPDPDRDRCGVLWIAPQLPMRGDDTGRMVVTVEREMLDHGFEPAISLRTTGGRSLRAIIGILFDRTEHGADARAAACWTALRERLAELRHDQYRHGLLDNPPDRDAGTARLLAALKAAADPHGILAPGRYGLR